MNKDEILEAIAEKAHDTLIEVGRKAEESPFAGMMPNTAQNPTPNKENRALRAMQKIDPYAHLREKTQMRKVGRRWMLTDK